MMEKYTIRKKEKDYTLEKLIECVTEYNKIYQELKNSIISNKKDPSNRNTYGLYIDFSIDKDNQLISKTGKELFIPDVINYLVVYESNGNCYEISLECFIKNANLFISYNNNILFNPTLVNSVVHPKFGLNGNKYNKFSNSASQLVYNIQSSYNKINTYYGSKSSTYSLTNGLKYSYGLEIECADSFVESNLAKFYNMSCVRDGSIGSEGGPEYVTGKLVGDAGLKQLHKICKLLSPISSIDKTCGIHVHLSGMKITKQFSLSLYKLCYTIQDDIFAMLPPSRRNNEFCRPLKQLDFELPSINDAEFKMKISKAYDVLIEHVGNIELLDRSTNLNILNKKSRHPLGRKCNYNHKASRYEWLNLVPMLFNERDNTEIYTVEFRPHSATLNYYKMKYWLLICMALINFCENNYKELTTESLSLNYVLEKVYGRKANPIIEYLNNRIHVLNSKKEELEYLDESKKEHLELT